MAATLFIVCGTTEVNGATQIIAITGNPAPDGNGVFSSLDRYSEPALNDMGQVAFRGLLSGTSDDEGIFRGSGGPLTQIARRGQTAPDGNGTYDGLFHPMINDSGQVAFDSRLTGTSGGTNDSGGVYVGSGNSVIQVARMGQSTPDGNGVFGPLGIVGLNNAGQVLLEANVPQGPGYDGVFVATSGGITQTVSEEQTTPDSNGIFRDQFTPMINEAGDVAFWDSIESSIGNNGGIYRASGGSIAQIAFAGQPAPDGNGVLFGTAAYSLSINDVGKVAFLANFEQTAAGGYDDEGVFLGTPDLVVQIAREGQPAPGGNGVFDWFDFPKVNNAGQVAFPAGIRNAIGGAANPTGIFLDTNGTITTVMRSGDAAPDGNGIFSSYIPFPTLNEAGQLAFLSTLSGTSGGAGDNLGIYLFSSGDLFQVARKGGSFAGSTIIDLALGIYTDEENGLNNAGQVAYWARLADGRELIALWTPPLDGDFNGDGIVDATDYVVWRKSNGTQQGFAMWRANFGRSVGGAGAANIATSTVPEPAGLVLMLLGAIMACPIRIR